MVTNNIGNNLVTLHWYNTSRQISEVKHVESGQYRLLEIKGARLLQRTPDSLFSMRGVDAA